MRILIVEDQANVAGYLKRALQEQGHAVDWARDGHEALDWGETIKFDLIVLDIMLPLLDGFTICQRLRNQGNQAAILMLTARNAVNDRVRGLDAGADDYLAKPFDLRELLARVRALGRRHSNRSPVLQLVDLTLNTRTRTVMRGDTFIDLTAKEYAVLECLMRAPHNVLTRTEIADAVWSYDVYHQSNVVDVYIRNLRRKIDAPFALKLIHTVRGAGYRLSDQGGDT
jgi:DNA-binding response OmpR family regulator